MISPRWALVPLACAGLLAACGSTPSTTTTTSSRSSTSVSKATTSTSTSTSTSSTAPVPTACTHVTGSPSSSQGAAGTITGFITVTNTGASSCSVQGYPTLALFSGSGAPLTVTVVDGLSVSLTPAANGAPRLVTLAPSSSARFAYQLSDVPSGSETSCPASEGATVTMPGSATPSPTFTLAIAPCDNGTVKVSPVFTG